LAIKPESNEAFYREVDEELRRDRAADAWDRYRWMIVGGLVLLLAAIGGFIWWQNHRYAVAGAQGEALVGAVEQMEKGGFKAATSQLAPLEESNIEGYRAAGQFAHADAMVEGGNVAGAIAIFQRLAADESLAEPYRNAALIRQTALEFDRLQPDAVIQRLRPLLRRGAPWFGSAGELTAHAHLRQQRPDLAAQVFYALARDETVPQSIRSRAVQMSGALGVDAVPAAPANQEGPPAPGPATAPAPAAAPPPANAQAPAAPATKE
jgi:hypothetical protein